MRRIQRRKYTIHTKKIYNEPIIKFGMSSPNRPAIDLVNDMQHEHQFNIDDLASLVRTNEQLLSDVHKAIYDEVISAIATKENDFLFIDASDGTDKTFLISLILAKVRFKGIIVKAIYSFGISATLLYGGKTAHLALKLPLNIQTNENTIILRNGKKWKYCKNVTLLSGMKIQWLINI